MSCLPDSVFLKGSGESWALTAVEHLQHLLSFLHPERLQEDACAFSRGEAIELINGESHQKDGICFKQQGQSAIKVGAM